MRWILLTSALIACAAHADRWVFDVHLDDKRIGEHIFTIERLDDTHFITTSEARFDVKVLMVPVFRYRHSSTEHWHGTCLREIDSETQANGKRFRLTGQRQGDSFTLDVHEGETHDQLRLPRCVATYAYWSPTILATHDYLLNSQTGAYDPIALTTDVSSPQLTGPSFVIHLRYRDSFWTGLSTNRDGRVLDYRLRETLDVAQR